MKVLIVGDCGEGFLPVSYAKALEALGAKISWFDSLRWHFQSPYYSKNRILRRLLRRRRWDEMNRDLFALVKDLKPGLVLTFKAAFLHPETIRRIKTQLGIPIGNYYPDNPYCGVPPVPNKTSAQRRDILECLRQYTLVLIWSQPLVRRLEEDGVRSAYLPFGADSASFRPDPRDVEERFRKANTVVFVGQRTKKRDRHLGAIDRARVTIRGPLWEKASREVRGRHEIRGERAFGVDCAAVYAHADVALNVVDDLNMPGHNMRTFEIPACGGAVMLSTYTKEQDEFFPEGEAACYYRDPEQMDAIIERLLGDRDLRHRIRANALRMALDHTYEHRAREMLKILGLC